MKATKQMVDSLRDCGRGDGLEAAPLTVKHLQFILAHQGYFSGIRYRYFPVQEAGKFAGWRQEDRVFGEVAA